MGRLSTHILDTAHGRPGSDVQIHLYRIEGDVKTHLCTTRTQQDGRCGGPLLEGDALLAGVYELEFHVGPYFAALGVDLPQPNFLDLITLRFGVADADAHYHVPLTVSPWSYSTYRGS
ncbi:MAG TPA: hydroxyisourate hydrolase [Janthinobacterium sp.]|nr:hydroxyisourate hydrolase [Janthinobacterium sp.]